MNPRPAPFVRTIFVCCNERPAGEDACANRGSLEIQKALKDYTKDKGVSKKVRVVRAMCLGLCKEGPNLCVMPENEWLNAVSKADVPAIVEKYVRPLE